MTSGIGYSGLYSTPNIVAPGGPIGLSTENIRNCKVSWLSVTQINISTGVCRSDDDTTDMQVTGILTVAITATGANGRNVDTAEQSNKWYAVFVIKNPTSGAVAGFLINQNDLGTFTFPAGYTKKRRVGWIRNDGSSNLRSGYYSGLGSYRPWLYNVSRSSLLALSAGSSTVFANVDISEWIPPTSITALINNYFDPSGVSFYQIRPDGSAVADPPIFAYESTDGSNTTFVVETNTTQIIEYKVDNIIDDLSIYVIGFFDEV